MSTARQAKRCGILLPSTRSTCMTPGSLTLSLGRSASSLQKTRVAQSLAPPAQRLRARLRQSTLMSFMTRVTTAAGTRLHQRRDRRCRGRGRHTQQRRQSHPQFSQSHPAGVHGHLVVARSRPAGARSHLSAAAPPPHALLPLPPSNIVEAARRLGPVCRRDHAPHQVGNLRAQTGLQQCNLSLQLDIMHQPVLC